MAQPNRKLSGGSRAKAPGRRSRAKLPRDTRTALAALANKPQGWAARYPINAAIREVMAEKGLSPEAAAELLHASLETVYAWNRSRPPKAPKMALALLCLLTDRAPHPALKSR